MDWVTETKRSQHVCCLVQVVRPEAKFRQTVADGAEEVGRHRKIEAKSRTKSKNWKRLRFWFVKLINNSSVVTCFAMWRKLNCKSTRDAVCVTLTALIKLMRPCDYSKLQYNDTFECHSVPRKHYWFDLCYTWVTRRCPGWFKWGHKNIGSKVLFYN